MVVRKHVYPENSVTIDLVALLLDSDCLEEFREYGLVACDMFCIKLDGLALEELLVHRLDYFVMSHTGCVIVLEMLLNGHRLLEETKVSYGEIWGKEAEA